MSGSGSDFYAYSYGMNPGPSSCGKAPSCVFALALPFIFGKQDAFGNILYQTN